MALALLLPWVARLARFGFQAAGIDELMLGAVCLASIVFGMPASALRDRGLEVSVSRVSIFMTCLG